MSFQGYKRRLPYLALNTFFMIYTILCIIPIVLVVMISLTDENSIMENGYRLIPKKFSSFAYEYVMADVGTIIRAYGVTIFVTVVGTCLGVLMISMYAYVLSRKDFKYRGTFSFIIFFTMLFNGGLVPWYMTWAKLFNLNNTIWILIIPGLLSPFYVLVLKTFFRNNVPDSIIESAKIDSAGEFRIFFTIVWPLAVPGLATIALFLALGYWNDWYNALIFISERKLYPMQYLLYEIQSKIDFLNSAQNMRQFKDDLSRNLPTETARMAMAIVGIGPIVLAYPFMQKYLISGLTIGSVKE